jgi:hypothetical protein
MLRLEEWLIAALLLLIFGFVGLYNVLVWYQRAW